MVQFMTVKEGLSVTEHELLKFIFSNQLLFCSFAGLMGGVVQALELGQNLHVSNMISKLIISFSGGTLVFFATYDMSATITPSAKITMSLVVGYCGSSVFKALSKRYFGGLNIDSGSDAKHIDLRRRR